MIEGKKYVRNVSRDFQRLRVKVAWDPKQFNHQTFGVELMAEATITSYPRRKPWRLDLTFIALAPAHESNSYNENLKMVESLIEMA